MCQNVEFVIKISLTQIQHYNHYMSLVKHLIPWNYCFKIHIGRGIGAHHKTRGFPK